MNLNDAVNLVATTGTAQTIDILMRYLLESIKSERDILLAPHMIMRSNLGGVIKLAICVRLGRF